MSEWRLGLDKNLQLHLPVNDSEAFSNSAFFKLSLKRFASDVSPKLIQFKETLTYLEYKKIISLCKKETTKRGINLIVEQSLAGHIKTKELHLESRSRLGVELKNQDEKHAQRFAEYSAIVNSSMSRRLRDKQMWDSFFMFAMQKSGNFSVPGSGKTSSVLGMYAYLKAKGAVRRIVVISPKNAFGSWIDEFSVCFDGMEELRLFNIHSPEYNTKVAKQRGIRLESGNCNLFLFNFESLGTYAEDIISLIDDQTMLVFDEVHKVKRVDGKHATGAVNVAKAAIYVTAMTGTPIPNSYLDIYNFLHILFPTEYDDFFNFSPAFLRDTSAEDREVINNKLQPFFCRTTKKQLDVPDANASEIISVDGEDKENRVLKILKMKYRKNQLALVIRIMQLESEPKMLLRSLDLNDFRYLLDDSVDEKEIDYADYSDEIKTLIESFGETTKMQKCIWLATKLAREGKPTVIWCVFIASIDYLASELRKLGISVKVIYGEVSLKDRLQIISDFKAGKFQILITNPHTLAESISLHSVCHDAIYFEYSYNLVHLLQSKDRIHRLGLPQGQYTQYYFLQTNYKTDEGEWSMGGAIYDRLLEKEKIMLDAIDNNVLEAMPTSKEDIAKIFANF